MVGSIGVQLEGVQSTGNWMSGRVQMWERITKHGSVKKTQKKKVLEKPIPLQEFSIPFSSII